MKKLKAKALLHRQAFSRSTHFMKQQPLTSIMTILMLALVLVLFLLFWSVSRAINQWTSSWQHNGHILLYLQVPTDPLDANHLLTQVQTTAGVQEATLTTPQQGLDLLNQEEGMQDIMRDLPNNPLPFVIDVVPAIDVDSPERLEQLYNTLKVYSSVENASLDLAWMKRLFVLLHFLSNLLNGLNVLLAVTVMLIIGNTLRLMIRDRSDEMMVYKFVGANNAYIMRPFLYSGTGYGFLAGLFACTCVGWFLSALNQKIVQFMANYPIHYQIPNISIAQSCGFLIVASFLGWLGAYFSTHLILRKTE